MSTSLSPEERKLRAQLAAHTRWAKPGARQAHGDKILAAKLARHEQLVDPDGKLDPAERRRLARHSLKAEMAALGLKAAKARRARQAAAEPAAPDELAS